ncbi:MAG: hypothetical protein [Circular genetic element sp.]|nr:MAG: hypothetical protein [Circular genetic element sp.]
MLNFHWHSSITSGGRISLSLLAILSVCPEGAQTETDYSPPSSKKKDFYSVIDLKINQYYILKGKKGMVNNSNVILDEGQNKYVSETKMSKRTIYDKFRKSWEKEIDSYVVDDECNRTSVRIDNPEYRRPTTKMKCFIVKYYKIFWGSYILNDENRGWAGKEEELMLQFFTKQEICDHLGVIPFNPCVMINISPDWKGKINPKDEGYQRLLAETIEGYLKSCNRYTKFKYCLECGGDGDFLHAHVVAEINPDLSKSVKTHINKGNHKYEIIKQFKKLKGNEGLLKGKFAIQRIMINNEEMRNDKLAYLIESNKPDGHTNKYDLDLVLGDF